MRLSLISIASLASLVVAHPGHDIKQEALERREFLLHNRNNLNHCQSKLAARNVQARAVERRRAKAGQLRRRELALRDTEHESSESYTMDTDPATIFAGNNSCVLQPEVTEGPYYVAGELIRENIVESQAGVPLGLDIQIVDVTTCEPVQDAYIEIWHCNSTCVYSGVVASGNGVGTADESNLDATFLRGVQQSSEDGVVQFETLFPGHYTGRATHVHIMVHLGASAQSNNTLMDTVASHVGQFFFDQDLISEVEAVSPYSDNTQSITQNDEDSILAEEASTDPYIEYVRLGDDISAGLFGWISIGINTTLSKNVSAAATLYEEGGVAGSDSMGGPGGSGGPGGPDGGPSGAPGDAPSGGPPGSGNSSVPNTSSYVSNTRTSATAASSATSSVDGTSPAVSVSTGFRSYMEWIVFGAFQIWLAL